MLGVHGILRNWIDAKIKSKKELKLLIRKTPERESKMKFRSRTDSHNHKKNQKDLNPHVKGRSQLEFKE